MYFNSVQYYRCTEVENIRKSSAEFYGNLAGYQKKTSGMFYISHIKRVGTGICMDILYLLFIYSSVLLDVNLCKCYSVKSVSVTLLYYTQGIDYRVYTLHIGYSIHNILFTFYNKITKLLFFNINVNSWGSQFYLLLRF